MNQQSAVTFPGSARVHIALEVGDLQRSIDFYRVLFGAEPVKLRPGYAKFEPGEPSVNLSLNQGRGGPFARRGGQQHFGVQVQSTDAVEALARRLRAAGLATRSEEETACCYAVQTKVWVEDPEGNPWEVFVVTQADVDQRSPGSSPCCTPSTDASPCCTPDPAAPACCP